MPLIASQMPAPIPYSHQLSPWPFWVHAAALADVARPEEPLLPICCAGSIIVHSGWGPGQ